MFACRKAANSAVNADGLQPPVTLVRYISCEKYDIGFQSIEGKK